MANHHNFDASWALYNLICSQDEIDVIDLDEVNRLLDLGADPNFRDTFRIVCGDKRKTCDLLRTMLNHGADHSEIFFHFVYYTQDIDMIEVMLRRRRS